MSIRFQWWRDVSVALACAVGVLVSAAVGGCLEEVPLHSRIATRLVESVCAAECGCERDRCEQWVAEQSEAITFLAQTRELQFDTACFESRLQQHAAAGCEPIAAPDADRCGYRCRLLYGDRDVGETCESLPRGGSDCQPEWECIRGVCADPCDDEAVGQPCEDLQCPTPALCDGVTLLCVAPPEQDEPCLNGACAGDLACIGGVCSGPRNDGQPCQGHSQCASGSCPNGFCKRKPGPGEACQPLVPCADGRECRDGVCDDDGGAGDACPCGRGLSCDNGRCVHRDPTSCGGPFVVG